MNQWSSSDKNDEFKREYAYWIQTDEGDELVFSLGMGDMAFYSRLSITSGQRVGHGQRCGFLYLAAVFDLYIPDNARVKVEIGDRVNAGTSIIGEYIHKT